MTILSEDVVTYSKTFSFYLGPDDRQLIEYCAARSDAVTIRGASGPATITRMRASGFDSPVMFDREGWRAEPDSVDVKAWIDEQRTAGAARLLTAGTYLPWVKDDPMSALARVSDEYRLAARLGATPVVAADARWLSKEPNAISSALAADCHRGVAVILVESGDPLGLTGAVPALRSIATNVPGLILLRSDHGALGAVAFGARHASLGLRPSHRHGTTPDRPGFGKQGDRTARVFSYFLGDWFTAATIAGWSLADPKLLRCNFACCDGADLSRFLDEDLKADVVRHNVTSLAHLADLVIDAPDNIRKATFLEYCNTAAERYDRSGFKGPQDPKRQLTAWILS